MKNGDDLYARLGVSRGASHDEIRSAYKKLARRFHPDVNPGDASAADNFKRVSAAYEVLSDADRRKAYDEFGTESLKSGFDPEKARAYRSWSQQRQAAGRPFEQEAVDFDLDDLFGGLGGFGARPRRGPRRGSDLRAVVELELAQAIRGAEVALDIPVLQSCSACGGSGDKPGTASSCAECGGSGQRQVARGPMRMMASCPRCGGSGKSAERCPACAGRGSIEIRRPLTVRIPRGADDGSTIRLEGKGAPGEGGGPPGDLVIETRVRRHPTVRRDGLDLTMQLPVRLDEVYAGAKVDVPTFEGPIKLTIPPQSQNGARLRVRGKGVERKGKRGDLFVELDVRMPDKADAELEQAFVRAREAYSRPVRAEVKL
jgi:molecular chaperone DnaJ